MSELETPPGTEPVEPPGDSTPTERAASRGETEGGGAVDLTPQPSASEEIVIDREAADALARSAPVERYVTQRQPDVGASAALPAAAPSADDRILIDHVGDRTHGYPGEEIIFFTRLRLVEDLSALTVRITLPDAASVLEAAAPPALGVPETEVEPGSIALVWSVAGEERLASGAQYEIQTRVRVPKVQQLAEPGGGADTADLICHAEANAPVQGAATRRPVAESAVLSVRAKGSYLKYLPAVYERDAFMARFVMLFESFWAPIQAQASNISDYFDPRLTPLDVVRWLADKLDLLMDEDWPEESQRRMLQKAVHLYRCRGTRRGLEELLETYTGARAQIRERRANNFRLGSSAHLGQGIALGAHNQPHTFSVSLRLPPIADDPARPGWAEQKRVRRQARIRALIDVEKPAHVTYTLDIDEPQS